MGGVFGFGLQRALNHLGDLGITNRARAARAIFVREAFNPVPQKPPPLFAHSVLMHAKPPGDLLALKPLSTQQDHSTTIRKRPRRLVTTYLSLQKPPFLIAQLNQASQTRHNPNP